LRFEIGQAHPTQLHSEHGSDFASRAPRDVDEREKFIRGAALEAFGSIVGDGQRGAVKLVAKTAIGLKRFILQEVFGLLVKLNLFVRCQIEQIVGKSNRTEAARP